MKRRRVSLENTSNQEGQYFLKKIAVQRGRIEKTRENNSSSNSRKFPRINGRLKGPSESQTMDEKTATQQQSIEKFQSLTGKN